MPRLPFTPAADAEFFSAIPASPAVFLLRGDDPASEPYVTKTANLRRRLLRLLGPAESASRRLNLRDRITEIDYTQTASDFESTFVLYQCLRKTFPKTYADRLRLRPAPFVKFILDNDYPRVTITTRIASLRAATENSARYYGPFASRTAAEKFANDSLDFFKIRRCTDDLHPAPDFPGCIYSEMKMCLAPCFKGCTDDEYRAEVARVEQFFKTGGRSLHLELSAERNRASENLEFEAAAALHTRLEKLAAVRQQLTELIRPIDRLDGLMVQPSAQPDSVSLFRIVGGAICASVEFHIPTRAAIPGELKTPLSMESRISEALATVTVPQLHSAQEWMEHLAILKRWYYRTTKVGELFLADEKGELPMRRIVRGVSRVFKGEKPMADLSESARDYWVNRGRQVETDTKKSEETQ